MYMDRVGKEVIVARMERGAALRRSEEDREGE